MGLENRSRADLPGPPYRMETWYRAYMSALFEADPALIELRVGKAEQLMTSRARELYSSGRYSLELRALDKAHSALQALLCCRKPGDAGGSSSIGRLEPPDHGNMLFRSTSLLSPQPERGSRG